MKGSLLMKNFMQKILSIVPILFVLLFLNKVDAQKVQPNRWFINANGGISVFYGDVKRYDYIPDWESPSEIQAMYSASLGKEISKIFSVRAQFLYGDLSGHKKSARYHFNSVVMGGHILADVNLYYLFTGVRYGDTKMNIFTSLGVGYMNWDSKLYYDTPLADGTELMDASKTGALSFPASLSAEYLFNKNFSANVEGLLYVVTSDEVDAKPGGIKVDMISYYSLGITYKFHSKKTARRSKVKYELDPSIYEAKPGDPQYREPESKVAVAKVEEKKIELPKEQLNPNVVTPTEVVVVDVKKQTEMDNQQAIKHDEEKFPINHKLEEKAIAKEVWAGKSENPWPEIKFSVQILASKSNIGVDEMKKRIGIPEKIVEKYDGEWYRYSAGEYDKLWLAKELRNKLRSNEGIKDAFIVVYRNEERISLEEALNFAARKQSVKNDNYIVEDKAAEKVYPMVHLEHNIPTTGILIGVQVLSIKSHEYPIGVFKGIYGIDNPIFIYEKEPWVKLIVSGFSTYEEASDFQFEARKKGFVDAFMVAFKNGRRISIKRLKQELSE